jgi:RNA polymerase sigma-70 factor, ECF subfamily
VPRTIEGGGAGKAMGREGADGRRIAGIPEAAAFMKLVRRHDRGLRMLAYRLLQDGAAMDDAMQDAYLKAFRGFVGFRGEAQARTWLYRIVYNTCLDCMRSERRLREAPLELATETESWGGGDSDPVDSAARTGDLAAALASLPADQRAAVLLVDAAGFTHDEAAGVLDVRPGTIASRLYAAREALRTTLAAGEG